MTPSHPSFRAGLVGGMVGGVSIWLYEALIWVGVQKIMPFVNIPKNAVGLIFCQATQTSLGGIAYVLGTALLQN